MGTVDVSGNIFQMFLDVAAKSGPVSQPPDPGVVSRRAVMRAICQGYNLGLVRPPTGFVMGGAALAHSADIFATALTLL